MSAVLKEKIINMRVPVDQLALISQALKVTGSRSRTAFILQASCEKAEEVLADRTSFRLNQQRMRVFNQLLDLPPREELKKLLSKAAPWEL